MVGKQFKFFPNTRYMGSKAKLIESIGQVLQSPERGLVFDSVLDAFAGSTVVSYYFKTLNKRVATNDFLQFSHHYGKAIIENNSVTVSENELEFLLNHVPKGWNFVQKKFAGLYFSDTDNKFLDQIRGNIEQLDGAKKSIALSALVRACLKKRPRGIFTYVGHRYDDGRKDVKISLEDHFIENLNIFNNAVFSNGHKNKAYNEDVYNLRTRTDLVYLDPPYCTHNSDNDYIRRYHFLEGLVRYWEGIEIQEHTTTKKFKRYKSSFDSKRTVFDAFDRLFSKFRNSIIIVSYSSNSIPSKEEMVELMQAYKTDVEVVELDHTYSFGNQNHKIGNKANRVKEYVFIGK